MTTAKDLLNQINEGEWADDHYEPEAMRDIGVPKRSFLWGLNPTTNVWTSCQEGLPEELRKAARQYKDYPVLLIQRHMPGDSELKQAKQFLLDGGKGLMN